MSRSHITLDGNEAAARVAYQLSEVIAIYPITPSSAMGEWADQWASERQPNLWGAIPTVIEMQSEGGAAGALHGALQAGALGTTFTASQGLLLMIPNMYKIAGELTPTVIHVAARAIAAQGLSIFGDHSDVMAARQTGFMMLASANVQEAQDFAALAHLAALEARLPVLHFFDGFRTSHEVAKIVELLPEDLRALVRTEQVEAHRSRALNPDRPVLRGTAQNPDVYFQGRETVNPYYLAAPAVVADVMARFASVTGRAYAPYEYAGATDAERVIVVMGSGAETAAETAAALMERGEKVGVLKVRLFRPFAADRFVAALPPTTRAIAVLDRAKEPGSSGEPLYLDVVASVGEAIGGGAAPFAGMPRVIGGRYGLSSKEFTPAMVKAVFDELAKPAPKNHFTVGIHDDVTHTSLAFDPAWSIEDPQTVRALFYGLGADGTVGANKNSIKIIGEGTPLHAQGYFVYDSKKSGSVTVSHLRFGPRPVRAPYLVSRANFVACHQFSFLERLDMLEAAEEGATFLLNAPYGPAEIWDRLPRPVQDTILARRLRVWVIDAVTVAEQAGLGRRINSVMQTCFFAISNVLPKDEAIAAIKEAIRHTYGRRGEQVVQRNFQAVDNTLAALHEVKVPATATSSLARRPAVPARAPAFVRDVTATIIAGKGDDLPVSKIPADGTWPTATARWERRNIALEIPVWDESICIQCGKCVLVCPHAVIRSKVVAPAALAGAPPTFKSAPARWKEFKDQKYTLQVAPEDCTGCALCVEVCPVKNKSEAKLKAINMRPQEPLRDAEAANWDFFLGLPDPEREGLALGQVKDVQLLTPLFEFSGACAGCGETPYVKLVTQLFGDRMVVANATGCSSIYGGNLPTTPWSVNKDGRGPAWSNSLFEDNAEFGLGMRLALDQQATYAKGLLEKLRPSLDPELVDGLVAGGGNDEAGVRAQRARVAALKAALTGRADDDAADLFAVADALIGKHVWIIGGDGWAYDIGYGGLDHVLASGRNVNILVLDTEVYSNTGGQASKATPRGAVAKFAAAGRPAAKKDLALMAMAYGNVFVAQVAMGADDQHTVKSFMDAAAWDGPSLIIAYSHCIAHGFDLIHGMEQQKLAVKTGYWPLFRYDPARAGRGEPALQLDAKAPSIPLVQFTNNETRYRMLVHADPAHAQVLADEAQHDVERRWARYQQMAEANGNGNKAPSAPAAPAAAAKEGA
jgi:pyruvate-ferredoxin/flavodoxin oxidoreductase